MFKDSSKKLKIVRQFLNKELMHVNMQLLYNCNFKCKICDFWKEPYRDHPKLTVEQTKIIAAKLKTIGSFIISIGGGEPLLHKDLVEITRVMAKDHFPVMICNG